MAISIPLQRYNTDRHRAGNTAGRTATTHYMRDPNQDWLAQHDAEYLKMIEQYKGTPYYDSMLNNPYLFKSNASFNPNLLQSIAMAFGDTSASSNYYGGLLNQRNQEFARLVALVNETKYNSPENQLGLEKAAGLNPDLTGISGVGKAAENDQPSTPFDMGNGIENSVGQVVNLASTVVGTALSFFNSLQGMKSVQLDNAMKEFSFNDSVRAFAWNVIKEGTAEFVNNPLSRIKDVDEEEVAAILEKGEFIEPIVKSFRNRVNNMPFSKRQKEALSGIFDDLVYAKDDEGTRSFSASYQKLVNDLVSDLYESREGVAKSFARPSADYESQGALRFMSMKIYRPLVNLQLDVDKALLNFQIAEAKSNTAYYSSIDGALKGEAENARNTMTKDMLDIKNRVVSTFNRINQEITGSKDLSPAWKIALEAGVSSAEVLIMNKLAL